MKIKMNTNIVITNMTDNPFMHQMNHIKFSLRYVLILFIPIFEFKSLNIRHNFYQLYPTQIICYSSTQTKPLSHQKINFFQVFIKIIFDKKMKLFKAWLLYTFTTWFWEVTSLHKDKNSCCKICNQTQVNETLNYFWSAFPI
jgi:hypothetical protein